LYNFDDFNTSQIVSVSLLFFPSTPGLGAKAGPAVASDLLAHPDDGTQISSWHYPADPAPLAPENATLEHEEEGVAFPTTILSHLRLQN